MTLHIAIRAVRATITTLLLAGLVLTQESLSQANSGSNFVAGNSNNNPYGISANAWATSLAAPNATYSLSLGGKDMSDIPFGPLWNLSIAVVASIPIDDIASSHSSPMVVTGTQVSFAPIFANHSSNRTQWKACIYFGAPGLCVLQSKLNLLNPRDACKPVWGASLLDDGFFSYANTTDSLSCPSAQEFNTSISGGFFYGWNTLSTLTLNQTISPDGGIVFKYATPQYSKGDMNGYLAAVETVWPVFSMWSIKEYNNGVQQNRVYSSLGCIFPATVTKNSVNFYTSSATLTGALPWPFLTIISIAIFILI